MGMLGNKITGMATFSYFYVTSISEHQRSKRFLNKNETKSTAYKEENRDEVMKNDKL